MLNYHHLQYFWAVAKDGNLTRTAARLRVSQSALSSQIRLLEERLGKPLFSRKNRALVLTEAGTVAMRAAEQIFSLGHDLEATLTQGRAADSVFRVGAVATLSRNFQESFIQPLIQTPQVRLRLESGRMQDLLGRLQQHELDVVLTNHHPGLEGAGLWHVRRLAQQPVAIVGPVRARKFRIPRDLDGARVLLPSPESEARAAFDAMCTQHNVRVEVFAEVDDMAMMRLLARDTKAIALLPAVVVRDELRSKVLVEYGLVPNAYETFYAVTLARQFEHPFMRRVLQQDATELLTSSSSARKPRALRTLK